MFVSYSHDFASYQTPALVTINQSAEIFVEPAEPGAEVTVTDGTIDMSDHCRCCHCCCQSEGIPDVLSCQVILRRPDESASCYNHTMDVLTNGHFTDCLWTGRISVDGSNCDLDISFSCAKGVEETDSASITLTDTCYTGVFPFTSTEYTRSITVTECGMDDFDASVVTTRADTAGNRLLHGLCDCCGEDADDQTEVYIRVWKKT